MNQPGSEYETGRIKFFLYIYSYLIYKLFSSDNRDHP